jgi:hypothetical protein
LRLSGESISGQPRYNTTIQALEKRIEVRI